ncbi:MAG: hypothetical protein DA446_04415 [Bacteroidetes bacterium]|nr:MAG: hypothetical protein DA446_04415 [Bacteroidota bacterium]
MHPAQPAHPAHPAHLAHPAHPAHPAHSVENRLHVLVFGGRFFGSPYVRSLVNVQNIRDLADIRK